jgi:hypothetical protein
VSSSHLKFWFFESIIVPISIYRSPLLFFLSSFLRLYPFFLVSFSSFYPYNSALPASTPISFLFFYSFTAASPRHLSSSPSTSFEPTALVIHLPKLSSVVRRKSCNLCFSFCTFLESNSIDPSLHTPSLFVFPSRFINR